MIFGRENRKMRRIIEKYFFILIGIFLIFSSILIINNNYYVSPLIVLLPIVYITCFFIVYFRRPGAFDSFVIIIFFAINFIRLIITPGIYVLSGYVSNIETSAGIDNLNLAVLLILFEFISVTLMIMISKKIKKIRNLDRKKELINNLPIRKMVVLLILFLIIIALLCVYLDNSVLSTITTIFDRFIGSDESALARRILFLKTREESSIIFNIFFQDIFYLQILIPTCLISYGVSKRKKISENKGFILGLLISIISVIFVTDNNIDSVCILLACLTVMYSLYQKRMSKILPILFIIVGGFIILLLFAKVGLLSGAKIELSELSIILNAYFASLPNISCSFDMEYVSKISTIFGDIVSGVPYLTIIFNGYPTSLTLFNLVAHGYSGLNNQIMPLISYGYQYLGVLAPTFTIIVYNIALHFELKYKETNLVFNKILYALMFINLSVGPSIFGFPNTIKRLCLYIPLLILIKINNKRFYKFNKNNYLKG